MSSSPTRDLRLDVIGDHRAPPWCALLTTIGRHSLRTSSRSSELERNVPNYSRRQLRVLPLGDGSYQRFWGVTGGRHTGPGTVSNLPKLWGRLKGDQKRSKRRGTWLFTLLPPPPPFLTGAGGCEPTVPCPEGFRNHPGGRR